MLQSTDGGDGGIEDGDGEKGNGDGGRGTGDTDAGEKSQARYGPHPSHAAGSAAPSARNSGQVEQTGGAKLQSTGGGEGDDTSKDDGGGGEGNGGDGEGCNGGEGMQCTYDPHPAHSGGAVASCPRNDMQPRHAAGTALQFIGGAGGTGADGGPGVSNEPEGGSAALVSMNGLIMSPTRPKTSNCKVSTSNTLVVPSWKRNEIVSEAVLECT